MNVSVPTPANVGATCAICAGHMEVVATQIPGYQRPHRYDVLRCLACDTSCVRPLAVEASIYDRIYAQIDRVPGYERYARYAREVQRRKDPLDYLASQEDIYWSIQRHMRTLNTEPASVRVLEVGSGLGYLTYALARQGYAATGIDISIEAVEAAQARYGQHYRCIDVALLAEAESESADVVIMTELIEHVVDPLALLRHAKKLLRSGGTIVLTTPNRTAYPQNAVWLSELPPIHLWWFSEESMHRLATHLDMRLTLTEFSAYSARFGFVEPADPGKTPDPVLNEDGTVGYRSRAIVLLLRRAGLYDAAVKLYPKVASMLRRAMGKTPATSARRATLCAVFSQR